MFGSAFFAGLEDFGFVVPDAAEFPSVEEGGPVDVAGEFAERLALDDAGAGEFGLGWGVAVPTVGGDELVFLGVAEGDAFFLGSGLEGFACFFVLGIVRGHELFALLFGEKGGGDGTEREASRTWTRGPV